MQGKQCEIFSLFIIDNYVRFSHYISIDKTNRWNVAMNATDTAQAAYDAADDQLADLHKRQQAALSDALAIISAHLPEVPLANGQALHDMVKEAIEESTFEVEQRLIDETEAAGLRLSSIENRVNVVAFQRSVL